MLAEALLHRPHLLGAPLEDGVLPRVRLQQLVVLDRRPPRLAPQLRDLAQPRLLPLAELRAVVGLLLLQAHLGLLHLVDLRLEPGDLAAPLAVLALERRVLLLLLLEPLDLVLQVAQPLRVLGVQLLPLPLRREVVLLLVELALQLGELRHRQRRLVLALRHRPLVVRAHPLEALRVLGQLGHQLLLDLDVRREVLERLLHLELRRLERLLRLARLLLLEQRLLLLEAPSRRRRLVGLVATRAARTTARAGASAARGRLDEVLLELGDARQMALEQRTQRLLGGRRERAARVGGGLLARGAVLRLQQQQLDARHLGRVPLAQPRHLVRTSRRLPARLRELRGELGLSRARRGRVCSTGGRGGSGGGLGGRGRRRRADGAADGGGDAAEEAPVVAEVEQLLEPQLGGRRAAAQPQQLGLARAQVLPQLRDERHVRVAVDDRLVLDVLGAVGVAQRVERLVQVDLRRRDARDHQRARVAAERVLQQPRQHRVAVRHVQPLSPLVAERRDHVAQHEQAQVDRDPLLHPLPLGLRALGALGPREVDKVELGGDLLVGDLLAARLGRRARAGRRSRARRRQPAHVDVHREDGVRARRDLVHVGRMRHAQHAPLVQRRERLFGAHDALLLGALHRRAAVGVLADPQLLLAGRRRVEQVADLLVVDLEERHPQRDAVRRAQLLDPCKDLVDGTRNDAA